MRITNEVIVSRSLDRLQFRLQRYERAQSQLATGRRIQEPSDDPAGTGQVLRLRAGLQARDQELRHIADARSWVGAADSSLQSALERLGRARDLAVRAGSTVGQNEREAIATEIEGIRDELLAVANTRHNGRPLFGGFSAGDAATTDPVTGAVTFTPPPGTTEAVQRRISDTETVTVSVAASEVFTFTGAAGGAADVFAALGELATSIRAGDPAAASTGLDAIDRGTARIGEKLAAVGATGNRIDSAERRTRELSLTLRGQLAEIEDVDIADAVMELQTQEVAYQATLQALARALPPSLVSFLR